MDVPPLMPWQLQPRVLRLGVVKFRSLKRHVFSREEILWLCKEMSRQNERWKYQLVSIQAISRRYRIHCDGLRNWKQMYEANVVLPSESTCCSNDELPLDTVGLKRILKWQTSADRDPVVLREIVAQELAATKRRRCNINFDY